MIIGLLGLYIWFLIVGYINVAFEDKCPTCDNLNVYNLHSITYECGNCGNVFNK